MENGHMSQKSSLGPRWEKTSIFFDFFKSFRKWRKSSYFHSRTTKIYKFTHWDGKWAHEWIEPKKVPRSVVVKRSNFFDLDEEWAHEWIEPKNFPRSEVGENFNFFDFFKSFRKWRKSSYSHSRTSKIYKFIHLDGKWAHDWIEPKTFLKSAVGEKLNLFDFLKSFRKWRISSYSHSRTTKIYKFTHLDGKWAHEWIEPKKFPRSAVGENFNFFRFFEKFSKMKNILIFSLQDK